MMKGVLVAVLLLVSRPCSSRTLPEEDTVVSIYTTQPTTTGTSSLDVYHQIANNIAERITSPIYRFLGYGKNKTEDQPPTKRQWEKIELLDEPNDVTKSINMDNNDIEQRDTEELSVDALRKTDRKPEKITLYSSYLPVKQNIDRNDTINEISDDDDEPFEFDDNDDQDKPRDGPFVFFLEILGSIVQLAWGAIQSVFKSSGGSGGSSEGNDSNL